MEISLAITYASSAFPTAINCNTLLRCAGDARFSYRAPRLE